MAALSKEKRNQVVLVGLLTLSVVVGLYMSVIRVQQEKLQRYPRLLKETEQKLENMRRTIKNADQTRAALQAASEKLAEIEAQMASGDLYAWLYKTIMSFKDRYKEVSIPRFSYMAEESEVRLLPKFPYRQVKISIGGTASFYDFGRFLADFENAHPYIRVENVVLAQEHGIGPATSDGSDKLSFQLEIVALVKPGST